MRQSLDEAMRIGSCCSRDDFFVRGFRLPVSDIVPNGSAEQPCILKHHTKVSPQVVPAHVVDIHPVDGYRAAVHIVKPHEQIDECGFASSGLSDNGHTCTRFNLQTKVRNERTFRVIGEFDMIKRIVPLLRFSCTAFDFSGCSGGESKIANMR